jgi:hypothetical protein
MGEKEIPVGISVTQTGTTEGRSTGKARFSQKDIAAMTIRTKVTENKATRDREPISTTTDRGEEMGTVRVEMDTVEVEMVTIRVETATTRVETVTTRVETATTRVETATTIDATWIGSISAGATAAATDTQASTESNKCSFT